VLGYIDSKDVLKRLLKGEQFSLADKGLVHTPLSIPDSLNLWEVLERMKAMDEDLAIVVNEYALVVGIISITDVTGVLMGNLLAMAEEEQQIVRRDENSWLMDGLTPLNDVMNELDIDEYPNPVGYETPGRLHHVHAAQDSQEDRFRAVLGLQVRGGGYRGQPHQPVAGDPFQAGPDGQDGQDRQGNQRELMRFSDFSYPNDGLKPDTARRSSA
jgi:hypothetical protein